MAQALANIPIYTNTGHTLTPLEQAFISSFLICKNVSQAVREAGYKCKRPESYGRALLDREYIREEISYRIQQIEDAKTAKPAEILQFYTSVMRGEVLDQFGIEASLDTRIKAANELAIPLRLEQKNMSNNVGSITLNFLPRNEENV